MDCSACCSRIDREESLRCSLVNCGKVYHLLCTGEKELTNVTNNSTWVCPECLCAAKKGGDNSLTPVGLSKKRDPNVTIRQKQQLVHTADEPYFSEGLSLKDEVKSLRREMTKMREQIHNSTSVIGNYESKICNAVSVIADYNTKLAHSITILASYETTIEKYALCTEALINKLKTYEAAQAEVSANPAFISTPASQYQPAVSPAGVPVIQLPSAVSQNLPPTEASLVRSQKLFIANPSTYQEPNKTAQTEAQKRKRKKVELIQPNNSASLHLKSQTTNANLGTYSDAITMGKSSKQQVAEKLEADTDAQQWVEVQSRKSRRHNISMYGTAGPSVTSLKAVVPRKHIHLWNMASSSDEVREYLDHLCPTGSCTVEELTAKGAYKSYKLGIPEQFYDVCYSMDVWPVNARIKPWINFRAPNKRLNVNSPLQEQGNSSQPFRKGPSHGAATTR